MRTIDEKPKKKIKKIKDMSYIEYREYLKDQIREICRYTHNYNEIAYMLNISKELLNELLEEMYKKGE